MTRHRRRQTVIAGLRFEPCAMCSQSGWVEEEIRGVKRMVRCPCWKLFQERIAALKAAQDRAV